MLNLDLFQYPDLPYEQLPENARQAALDSISKRRFTALEDYSPFSLKEDHSIKTNILAFTHRVYRNPEYTGLTVFNAVNGHDDKALVSLLARSAAPFYLIHREDKFSFWACPVRDNSPAPAPVEVNISYDQLESVLSKYDADLSPKRIIDVKQGRDTFTLPIFRDIQPLQLSLWADGVTRNLLVKHFAVTVKLLRDYINYRSDVQETEKDTLVTNLAIQLLGAIILADTGVFGDSMRLERPSLYELILKASATFERYFKLELFKTYFYEAEQAYQLLQKLRYASFMPDMLSELYKAAYSKEKRKVSGSYDTPLHLTRRIWENIPVEYLPPEKRVVADMTCGWGSFLVAGHERLSSMGDMQNVSLQETLNGNDDANFTSQLAGLGLLLSVLEDSWHIDQSDALKWTWLDTHQPNIIVGNPPFEADRRKSSPSGGDASAGSNTRREKANRFLQYAIDRLAPGGYLAMIMPRSFTEAEASPLLRKHLLETCDLLELWELPIGIFSDATVQTVVLFAQKKEEQQSPSHSAIRVRTIQPKTRESFKHVEALTVTASSLVVDQSTWNEQKRRSKQSENTHIMDYKTILAESTWEAIFSHCKYLREYTEIFRGATVGTPSASKKQRGRGEAEPVPWLQYAKSTLKRSFFIDYRQATTIMYPDGLQWPRLGHRHFFDRTKVAVVYTQNLSWGRRVKVAIERKKHYMSDDFWIVATIPSSQSKHITDEVVAAILSWDVSNAWVIEHMRSSSVQGYAINTVPIPKELSEEDCKNITQAILTIEAAAYASQPEPVEATQTIDIILKRAYHLDEATFERLRQVKEWDSKPQITLDPQPDSSKANWRLSGSVDSIDAEQGTITLWMEGFQDLQTVQIVPSMPGWMLRPGAAFDTKIPRAYVRKGSIDQDAIDWGAFQPHSYTYLSEEEQLDELFKRLQRSEATRTH